MKKGNTTVVSEQSVDVFELLKYKSASCSAKMGERVPLYYCLACGNEGCPGYVRAEHIVFAEGGNIDAAVQTCQTLSAN